MELTYAAEISTVYQSCASDSGRKIQNEVVISIVSDKLKRYRTFLLAERIQN